jgi:hypothetical protein
MIRAFLLPICLTSAACTLIDQRTFAPSPEAAPAPVAQTPSHSVPIDSRPALIVIDYTVPQPRYQELLRVAVRAAEARYGNVQYDVVAVLADAKDAAQGRDRAVAVMRGIMAENVPAARAHLALRTEPGLSAGQIRVYVR